MTPQNDLDVRKRDGGSLLLLAVLAAIVGAAAGILGALFRLSLLRADQWRDAMVRWAQGEKLAGLVVVVIVCAASAAIAAWLVRRFSPHASGSGIPHVEAVLDGELPPAPLSLIPVKFFGGVLAIGSGLALGREGPTVQMGAGIAHIIGKDMPLRLAGLPGAAGGGRRRRPGYGIQRSDRGCNLRPGGAGAAFRAAHRHRGACRIGNRHLGIAPVPWRRTGLSCRAFAICSRRDQPALFCSRRRRRLRRDRLQPRPARRHRAIGPVQQSSGRAARWNGRRDRGTDRMACARSRWRGRCADTTQPHWR